MSGSQRELTMRFLAEPTDVNYGGKVHGGVVMKWIDQAGYAAAVGWSGRYSVTVAVGGIRFVSPIRTSDLVTVRTKLVYTGTSSMSAADATPPSSRTAPSSVFTSSAVSPRVPRYQVLSAIRNGATGSRQASRVW